MGAVTVEKWSKKYTLKKRRIRRIRKCRNEEEIKGGGRRGKDRNT